MTAIGPEPDSEGCLLLVASYSDTAAIASSVATKAAAGIVASPELGDFFELRFTDLGSRPLSPAAHADAVARIAAELTRPTIGAGRCYFALVITDRSAEVASELLTDCEADPVISALPIRSRSLVSADVDTVTGSDEGAIVRELQRYARYLLQDFASGDELGLTPDELSGLQPKISPAASDLPDEPAAAPPLRAPVPLPVAAGTSPRRFRVRRRHNGPPPSAPVSRPGGLVYLILLGDEATTNRNARRRGQSVLLDIGKRLGAESEISYRVRVLRDTADAALSRLLVADHLTRRDLGRPGGGADLPRLLGVLRAAVRRDRATLRPTGVTVILFAADVPLADAVTTPLHGELTREACLVWIVPPQLADLISPSFADAGAWVIIDYPEIADEILDTVRSPAVSLGLLTPEDQDDHSPSPGCATRLGYPVPVPRGPS
jgi:hypothetical protein